jgi:hypothetical protein
MSSADPANLAVHAGLRSTAFGLFAGFVGMGPLLKAENPQILLSRVQKWRRFTDDDGSAERCGVSRLDLVRSLVLDVRPLMGA